MDDVALGVGVEALRTKLEKFTECVALLVQPTLRTDRDEKVSAARSHNVERPSGPVRCVVEANVDVSSS